MLVPQKKKKEKRCIELTVLKVEGSRSDGPVSSPSSEGLMADGLWLGSCAQEIMHIVKPEARDGAGPSFFITTSSHKN
jgi:hypothetical protein